MEQSRGFSLDGNDHLENLKKSYMDQNNLLALELKTWVKLLCSSH